MTHREIRELLADFTKGRLQPQVRIEIEGHLASCSTCRDWLETYALLGREMSLAEALKHPGTADLADWTVLGDDAPAEGMAHLEACTSCRRDVELLGAAVTAARAGLEGEGFDQPPPAPRHRRAAMTWAVVAAVLFAVVAGSILLAPRGGLRSDRVLARGELSGEEIISARSIYAVDLQISSGSNVVFETSDMLTLGDGFVVASGATFAVGTAGSTDDSDQES